MVLLVIEVINLKKRMNLFFKDTGRDIRMTNEEKEDMKFDKILRFCEKSVKYNKVRGHCL